MLYKCKIFTVALLCFLLSACGSGCIYPYNPQEEVKDLNICVNQSKKQDNCVSSKINEKDPKSYWAQMSSINNDEVAIHVKASGDISTCSGCSEICYEQQDKCNSNSCEVVSISSSSEVITKMQVNEGDFVAFSLVPSLYEKITKSTCTASDNRFYFKNQNDCNERIGEFAYSLIGNSKTAKDNVLYYNLYDKNIKSQEWDSYQDSYKTTYYAELIKNAFVDDHKAKDGGDWIETNILYSTDSANAFNENLEKVINLYRLASFPIVDQVAYTCMLFKIKNPSDEEKNIIDNIKKRVDLYTLNRICGGAIRNVYYNPFLNIDLSKELKDDLEQDILPNGFGAGLHIHGNPAGPVLFGNPSYNHSIDSESLQFYSFLPSINAEFVDKNGNVIQNIDHIKVDIPAGKDGTGSDQVNILEQDSKLDYEKSDNEYHQNIAKGINLGYSYKYNKSGESYIKFSIPLAGLKGGYTIRASKYCDGSSKRSLYMYVGDEIPNFKPGEEGSQLVELDKKIPINGSGNIYFGIKSENIDESAKGYFNINLTQKRAENSFFSNIIMKVRNQILKLLYGDNTTYNRGIVGSIYYNIANSVLADALRALLILYLVVYSILFLIGAFRTPQFEFVIVISKIAVLSILLSPYSWDFFNNNLFGLFKEGSIELISIMSGSDPDSSGHYKDFEFIDKVFDRFITQETWLQIKSLLFSSIGGVVVVFIILFAIWEIIKAICKVCVYYLMSLILVALLLCLAPIFLSLVLFKRTKQIFDFWIKNLAQVAMFPVFTFATLAFLVSSITGIIYTVFDFSSCAGCVVDANLPLLGHTCLYTDYIAQLQSDNVFFPISFTYVIALILIINLLDKFIEQSTNMARNIFGAFGADISAQGGPAESFMDSLKSIFGQSAQHQQGRASQEYQQKLQGEKKQPEVARRK